MTALSGVLMLPYCSKTTSSKNPSEQDSDANKARDSTYKAGGIYYYIPSGRRDGTVSLEYEVTQYLPPPFLDVPPMIQFFTNKILQEFEEEYGTANFTSDQVLSNCPLTDNIMKKYIDNPEVWIKDFAEAMVHLGNLDVLTGTKGEIRNKCGAVN
ncbi:hypothetical protein POM88_014010 [Heracleum sosnowskyi]|uniref:peroxidase n=1 Tax=Heracleum sosnowskyi TaxID=360622 RepID=A0AAD8N391_9APIA|nr:hypothetical protein POM88_014010 [Heracleum sosnowskyi]